MTAQPIKPKFPEVEMKDMSSSSRTKDNTDVYEAQKNEFLDPTDVTQKVMEFCKSEEIAKAKEQRELRKKEEMSKTQVRIKEVEGAVKELEIEDTKFRNFNVLNCLIKLFDENVWLYFPPLGFIVAFSLFATVTYYDVINQLQLTCTIIELNYQKNYLNKIKNS